MKGINAGMDANMSIFFKEESRRNSSRVRKPRFYLNTGQAFRTVLLCNIPLVGGGFQLLKPAIQLVPSFTGSGRPVPPGSHPTRLKNRVEGRSLMHGKNKREEAVILKKKQGKKSLSFLLCKPSEIFFSFFP